MYKKIIIIIGLTLLSIQNSKADSVEYIKYSFLEIDTSCLKNPGIDFELKNKNIFIDHLQFVIKKFTATNSFTISDLLVYEDSIKAKDVSLGYYYSLDTGYYPFYNKFKFGIPYRFQRIECPAFDAYTEYFYTKRKKTVKVVGYIWYEHMPVIENVFFNKDLSSELQRGAFVKKYIYIEQTLNLILGMPIQSINSSGERKTTKWKTNENINAILESFGNYFNEIRLFLYKD